MQIAFLSTDVYILQVISQANSILLFYRCLTIAAATGSLSKFMLSRLSSRLAQLDENEYCINSFHETATDVTAKRRLKLRSVLQ
jgi:hypothetical protein